MFTTQVQPIAELLANILSPGERARLAAALSLTEHIRVDANPMDNAFDIVTKLTQQGRLGTAEVALAVWRLNPYRFVAIRDVFQPCLSHEDMEIFRTTALGDAPAADAYLHATAVAGAAHTGPVEAAINRLPDLVLPLLQRPLSLPCTVTARSAADRAVGATSASTILDARLAADLATHVQGHGPALLAKALRPRPTDATSQAAPLVGPNGLLYPSFHQILVRLPRGSGPSAIAAAIVEKLGQTLNLDGLLADLVRAFFTAKVEGEIAHVAFPATAEAPTPEAQRGTIRTSIETELLRDWLPRLRGWVDLPGVVQRALDTPEVHAWVRSFEVFQANLAAERAVETAAKPDDVHYHLLVDLQRSFSLSRATLAAGIGLLLVTQVWSHYRMNLLRAELDRLSAIAVRPVTQEQVLTMAREVSQLTSVVNEWSAKIECLAACSPPSPVVP